jgi:hypothetical protein
MSERPCLLPWEAHKQAVAEKEEDLVVQGTSCRTSPTSPRHR